MAMATLAPLLRPPCPLPGFRPVRALVAAARDSAAEAEGRRGAPGFLAAAARRPLRVLALKVLLRFIRGPVSSCRGIPDLLEGMPGQEGDEDQQDERSGPPGHERQRVG